MNKAKEVFFENCERQNLALTFDDVREMTGASFFESSEIDTTSRFSRNVEQKVPISSAAMDTVTESDMAIAMAKLGGIGVIHAGLSIKEQRFEVRRVKLHLNGLIEKPIDVKDTESVGDVLEMCDKRNFDFRTFPVIDSSSKFIGMLTQTDFDFCDDRSTSVKSVMTPISEVISAPKDTQVNDAYQIMKDRKKKTLPLINDDGTVAGLYILSDVLRIVQGNPNQYNLDPNARLMVAAAVPTDPIEAIERVKEMGNYLDVAVIDSAHGDSKYAFHTLKAIKEEFKDIDVVVGNISVPGSALSLAEAGADGIKVGQGPGSICTTRAETGTGSPQVTAVYQCAKAIEKFDIPICADGGITNPGDISIAIASGAHNVMLGGMLAGTKETPGDLIARDGSMFKLYRGMGSPSALKDNAAARKRYGAEGPGKPLAEGVEKYVPYRGTVTDAMDHYVKALRRSMHLVGAQDIQTHRIETLFVRITNAGLRESNVHEVPLITRNF